MSIVAIIPARGGSKGIPRKNLAILGGRPLIAWSILAGQESGVDLVLVSTEDPEIADVAQSHGAEVIPRPAHLAQDHSSTDAVLVHALTYLRSELEPPHLVVLLQPTVPLRPAGLVDACVRHLEDTDADSLLTAHKLHFVWRRDDVEEFDDHAVWRCSSERRPARQALGRQEQRWHEDGAVYVCRASLLEERHRRIGGRVRVHPNEPTVDIDEPRDLAVAEALLPMVVPPAWLIRRAA